MICQPAAGKSQRGTKPQRVLPPLPLASGRWVHPLAQGRPAPPAADIATARKVAWHRRQSTIAMGAMQRTVQERANAGSLFGSAGGLYERWAASIFGGSLPTRVRTPWFAGRNARRSQFGPYRLRDLAQGLRKGMCSTAAEADTEPRALQKAP